VNVQVIPPAESIKPPAPDGNAPARSACSEECGFMTADTGSPPFRLGFLTAIEVPERGFVGGLLITNHFGRPLEFQCTAPLKPNRTQEILYGPTLVPYLLGDLIGRTLIEKVGIKPHLVLTERGDLLPLRDLVEVPVACVEDISSDAKKVDTSVGQGLDASGDQPPVPADKTELTESVANTPLEDVSEQLPVPEAIGAPITKELTPKSQWVQPAVDATAETDTSDLRLGRQVLRFHGAHSSDRTVARRGAAVVPTDADLREPFERVREALNETARIGGTR
jgi:hypothetical protein